MGTQELPCFVRLKRNSVFLSQLTGLYCETGKNSDELASKVTFKGNKLCPTRHVPDLKAHPQFVWWNGSIRALSKFGPARPYIARFKVFSRLIWPSA